MNTFKTSLGVVLALCVVNQVRSDNIYVSVYGSNSVVKFDSSGPRTTFASNLEGPEGLAVDGSGNVFVANFAGNMIVKMDPGGNARVFAGVEQPQNLAFDHNGNLYVTCYLDPTIRRFDPHGNLSIFANTSMKDPFGMAFDSDGNLFVADYSSSTLQKFDAQGNPLPFTTYGPYPLVSPLGLVFSPSGALFVANSGAGDILGLNEDGASWNYANTDTGFSGLAFDSQGHLFAVNYLEMWIEKFDPPGLGTTFAVLGGGFPSSIAIEPGPGPAIRTPPASQTRESGESITLGVSASGRAPLFYSWLFNGTNVLV